MDRCPHCGSDLEPLDNGTDYCPRCNLITRPPVDTPPPIERPRRDLE